LVPDQRWFPADEAFAKNCLAVGFKLDYVKSDGYLSNYVPDFLIRTGDKKIWIVETKGRAELDLPQKMARLKQLCADATAAEAANGGFQEYDFVFVDQVGFEKHAPKNFRGSGIQLHRFQVLIARQTGLYRV
jgi:type III restriction enzyme